MQSYSHLFALLVLSISLPFFAGCGGTGTPVPASSSASSEAADAAGGENKTPPSDAGAPNKGDAKEANETKDQDAKNKDAKDKEAPTEEKGKP